MSIEIGVAIDNAVKYLENFSNSGSIFKVFKSPLYMSILIVITVLLIIEYMYPSPPDSGLSVLKTGLYIFVATFLVLILHTSIVKNEMSKTIQNMSANEIVDIATGGFDRDGFSQKHGNLATTDPDSDVAVNPELRAANGNDDSSSSNLQAISTSPSAQQSVGNNSSGGAGSTNGGGSSVGGGAGFTNGGGGNNAQSLAPPPPQRYMGGRESRELNRISKDIFEELGVK